MGMYFTIGSQLDLSGVKSNEIMYKDSNGIVKGTGMFLENDMIVSTKDLQIPPNTLHIGDNIELHENGGFLEYLTKTLNKSYIVLMSENLGTGSLKPVYYKRDAIETDVKIQSENGIIMDNITEIDITPDTDAEVSKVYFDSAEPITNFKAKIEVNGNDVAYYPSKNAWNDSTVAGYNLNEGINSISLIPHFSFLTSYVVKIHIKADSNINLNGNGTVPYLAIDRQKITKLEVITEDKQLVSNTLYCNDNKKDIQELVDSTTGYNAILVSPGSYGGDTLNVASKTQLSVICQSGGGIAITELSGSRAMNITGCSRFRLGNLQVEGLTTISGGTGAHYFRGVNFYGGLTIGNESGFIVINECEIEGPLTIANTFTGVLYILNTNFTGQTVTNNATTQQVIIGTCTNLPTTLANVYLVGINGFSNMTSRLDVSAIYINGVNITSIFQPKS